MEEILNANENLGNIVKGYCDGCHKIDGDLNCTVYRNPPARCRVGCAFSPKVREELMKKQSEKKRVGQQKQAKKDKKKK